MTDTVRPPGMSQTTVLAFRLALAAVLMAITYLAATPVQYPIVGRINDKVNHVAAFSVLALLADFSFPQSGFGRAKVLVLIGYGLTIEGVQYFLSYRSFSLFDLVADGIGITLYRVAEPFLRHVPVLCRRWNTGKWYIGTSADGSKKNNGTPA